MSVTLEQLKDLYKQGLISYVPIRDYHIVAKARGMKGKRSVKARELSKLMRVSTKTIYRALAKEYLNP